MTHEIKKERIRKRIELFKIIWKLILAILFLLLFIITIVRDYQNGEQPSNLTVLTILLGAIILYKDKN